MLYLLLVGDVITQFSNISPQISISAQYVLFIFGGGCDQLPDFSICHDKSPPVPDISFSYSVGIIVGYPIFQYFTTNLHQCLIFDIHF